MRKCSVCGVQKSLDAFHRDASKASGVVATCKDCAKERSRRWFAENRERGLATRRDWYETNRVDRLSHMKKYRQDNYGTCLDRNRRWMANNKERKLNSDLAWQKSNPEKLRTYRRVSEARRRAAEGYHSSEDLSRIRKLQGGKCAICRNLLGSDDHTDHINPLSKGGTNWPNNIQLLCEPRNLKKHARDPIDHMRSLGLLL